MSQFKVDKINQSRIGTMWFLSKNSAKWFLVTVVFLGFSLFGSLALAKNNPTPPVYLCTKSIELAGIPIYGVSGWPVKRIDFREEATEEQKQQAWDIVKNFDYEKELAEFLASSSEPSIITSYGSGIPNLTQDGQITVAQVNGHPYIYFQADGKTQHILGASSFEISAHETTDALSGEKMQVGDFVIGMIDQNLNNGATPEDSSMHGIWVKWSSVKAQLIEEIKASGGLSPAGGFASGAISGVEAVSFVDKVKTAILGLGITIKDGIVSIVNLAVENFSAKTARIEKLEMVDKATGDIYCTWIENGENKKERGSCKSLLDQVEPVVPIHNDPMPSSPAPEPVLQPESSLPSPLEPVVVPVDQVIAPVESPASASDLPVEESTNP